MIAVRALTPGDRPVLEAVLSEINVFYTGAPRDAGKAAAIADDLIAGRFMATVLACEGDDVLGLAIYTVMQPAPQPGGTLFLKELFVREAARNRGTGRVLLAHLTRTARDRGCARIEWTAGRDQDATLRFYRRLNAREVTDKVFFRVPDHDFDGFLARLEQ